MIEFTGERVIPGQVDPDLWAEHISRYAFAARFATGARVLDLGCGAGYGTAELAGRARSAIGIDLAPEAIAHATAAYSQANVFFVPASGTRLPFRGASFELITAFEVIEHLTDWRGLLSEARRLLHPSGVFLVSTPNKEYYTASRGSAGPNPFHTHEFDFEEYRNVLTEFFPYCTVLLQNHVEAFAFYQQRVASAIEGRMDGVRGTPREAHFFLAVCSLREPPPSPAFLFVHQASNVLREREKHIESLQHELLEARGQYAALHGKHEELTAHMEEQNRWALRTEVELAAARRDLTAVLENLAAAENTVIERTHWAQKLAAQVHELGMQVEDFTARLNLWRSSRWIQVGRKLNLGPDLDQSPAKGDASGGGS
ncbi:MAG: methyltransferase domain-containing protein [Acidobacteriota bacterium]|nr:methyltransferase domain-containing protein [Acidobacteriota bacterium]